MLAWLIWLSVRRGLSPLDAMAVALEKRPASDLSALSNTDAPSGIRPVIRALNGLFGRVNAARERERDFTTFAAHELRTPIAGLKTQAQVAMGVRDDDSRMQALRQIMVGVDRTSRLVRQLTDLTNAESLEDDVPTEKVNRGSLIGMLASDIRNHDRTAATIVIDEQLRAIDLVSDQSLMMLAARNLLENAVNHSGENGSVHLFSREDDRGIQL